MGPDLVEQFILSGAVYVFSHATIQDARSTLRAGVSQEKQWDMNSLCVPRVAKEAIGAICTLRHSDGSCMTINVEYNQLDPLLRDTVNPDGAPPHPHACAPSQHT